MDAREELEALWSDVFGEPPPIRAQPEELLKAMIGSLTPAPAYTPGLKSTSPELERPPSVSNTSEAEPRPIHAPVTESP